MPFPARRGDPKRFLAKDTINPADVEAAAQEQRPKFTHPGRTLIRKQLGALCRRVIDAASQLPEVQQSILAGYCHVATDKLATRLEKLRALDRLAEWQGLMQAQGGDGNYQEAWTRILSRRLQKEADGPGPPVEPPGQLSV